MIEKISVKSQRASIVLHLAAIISAPCLEEVNITTAKVDLVWRQGMLPIIKAKQVLTRVTLTCREKNAANRMSSSHQFFPAIFSPLHSCYNVSDLSNAGLRDLVCSSVVLCNPFAWVCLAQAPIWAYVPAGGSIAWDSLDLAVSLSLPALCVFAASPALLPSATSIVQLPHTEMFQPMPGRPQSLTAAARATRPSGVVCHARDEAATSAAVWEY